MVDGIIEYNFKSKHDHLFLKSFRELNYFHGNYNKILKKLRYAVYVFKVMIGLFKALIEFDVHQEYY